MNTGDVIVHRGWAFHSNYSVLWNCEILYQNTRAYDCFVWTTVPNTGNYIHCTMIKNIKTAKSHLRSWNQKTLCILLDNVKIDHKVQIITVTEGLSDADYLQQYKALLGTFSTHCCQRRAACSLETTSTFKWLQWNRGQTSTWHLCRLFPWQGAFVKCRPADRPAPAADGCCDQAGKEDGVLSYPAPGPAGRTTALPLRLRIPPLSLSLPWVTPGKPQKQAPLSEQ